MASFYILIIPSSFKYHLYSLHLADVTTTIFKKGNTPLGEYYVSLCLCPIPSPPPAEQSTKIPSRFLKERQ